MPSLLNHIIEHFLKGRQMIIVPNHGQLTDQGRILLVFRPFIPDLVLKILQLPLLNVFHIDLQALASLGKPR